MQASSKVVNTGGSSEGGNGMNGASSEGGNGMNGASSEGGNGMNGASSEGGNGMNGAKDETAAILLILTFALLTRLVLS